MEKDNLATPTWNPSSFGMKMQSHELNCAPQQLPNSLYNANWDNSVDQSDPFESALSSIVSSPAASNAATTTTAIAAPGDGDMIRELIGRLGSICNSGEISSQSYIYGSNNNNSTNTSCYSTPLNSSPKLNLSLIDPQMRGNLPISHPSLAPFSADPAFVERAARFSCFGGGNFGGLNGQQFNLNEAELAYNRSMPRIDSGKLSRASSNQSLKLAAAGSQMGVQESNKSSPQDGNSAPDKKFSRFSRSSTPENAEFGDSREGSSVSEQIPGGDLSVKPENVTNSRKRKSGPRGKAKETPSSPSAKDGKVVAENEEPIAKRSKADEASGNEKETAKSKTEPNGGTQKQTKDNSESPEPPKDYIHVRARRGQATDSHSLAERVRREKISERMKFLQDLVPGCNKVTGKAVMLDEIINYVQSLQRQVEFLSMKLATVNPRMDLNMEALLSKEIFQSRGSLQNALYQLESAVPASFPFGYQPQQLPPLHNSSNISSGTETQFPANPLNAALGQNQLPAAFDRFGEATPQVPTTFFEDDLQSVVQMGFGQIQQQSLHGSMASAQMKIEL